MSWKTSLIAMVVRQMEKDFFHNARTALFGSVQDRRSLKAVLIALNMPAESLRPSFERIQQQKHGWTR